MTKLDLELEPTTLGPESLAPPASAGLSALSDEELVVQLLGASDAAIRRGGASFWGRRVSLPACRG